jgi:hypothetical protein
VVLAPVMEVTANILVMAVPVAIPPARPTEANDALASLLRSSLTVIHCNQPDE